MRVAVLSDVHGNRQAFEAVLEDLARTDPDAVWCLGDLVGYGADPEDCVRLAREHVDLCLAGNHDLAVTGALSLDDFSRGAAIAAEWTREQLAEDARAWLDTLSPMDLTQPVGLYHASPRDPVWEYVLNALLADLCLDRQEARVSLVGHSHVALSFERPEGEIATGEARRDGTVLDLSEGEWLLNPGSVGQPRDGDPRAAWLELDLEAWRAAYHRVDYDVAGAQRAIRDARLPSSLADRLEYGQ